MTTVKSYWLSFCDSGLPEGAQFLGAAIVPGGDMIEAVHAAHALGCNPGGEVLGVPIPEDIEGRYATRWRCRLLTRAECEQVDAEIERQFS